MGTGTTAASKLGNSKNETFPLHVLLKQLHLHLTLSISGVKICTGTWMSPSHVASPQARAAYRACHHPESCAREGQVGHQEEFLPGKGGQGLPREVAQCSG